MNKPVNTPRAVTSHDEITPPRALSPGDLSEAIPLHEALCGIGEVLQLPRKRPTAPTGMAAIGETPSGAGTRSRNTKTIGMPAIPAPANTYASARRQERRWLAGSALAATALVALAASMAGDAPRRDPMPTALHTEWRTTHPSYAHTLLAFTDSTVHISTFDPDSETPDRRVTSSHAITGFVANRRGELTAFVVRYDVDGEPDQIEAHLTNSRVPVLSFVRPEGLTWYPARTGSP